MEVVRTKGRRPSDPTETDGVLYFHVYKPALKAQFSATVSVARWQDPEHLNFDTIGYGVPVAEAWARAKALADEYGCYTICVYDPDDAVPKAR